MPDKGEMMGGVWALVGTVFIVLSIQESELFGPFLSQALLWMGLVMMSGGPFFQMILFEILANRNSALGASIEPWMNGKRTIYIGDVRTIRSLREEIAGVPRFLSQVELRPPYFKHPRYGIPSARDPQTGKIRRYFYLEHNFGFYNRVRFRPGKGSYRNIAVNLRGIDGNVVLSEHPVPIIDGMARIPVFDLVRAGADWDIENGNMLPSELMVVGAEHIKEAKVPSLTS